MLSCLVMSITCSAFAENIPASIDVNYDEAEAAKAAEYERKFKESHSSKDKTIRPVPHGHHDHTGTPKQVAEKVAKKAEQDTKKQIKEANSNPLCQPAYTQATRACTSKMDRASTPVDREQFQKHTHGGVSKISEADAHNHHLAGDQNAIYAGECRAYAGSCIDICTTEKTPEAITLLNRCKSYDKHADHHEEVAAVHYHHQEHSYQIALSTSEDNGDNGGRKGGSSNNSGSGGSNSKGESEASSGGKNGGFGSMADRMAAFQQGRTFLKEAFGNNEQGSMSAQSLNPSLAAEPQYQQDLKVSAERDLRNSAGQESTELQQAQWSNPAMQAEVSNSESSSSYQPASANSLGGAGRIPSSGAINAASNSGGGNAASGGLPGRAAASANSGVDRNQLMPYEPMYRMIKVGNVDAASGNGSSEGRNQAKTINLNDYLPNGSQYQNGYSPSGMDVSRHEIQPQATNIWGLISDRTRTLCAQKRLYDCNGH